MNISLSSAPKFACLAAFALGICGCGPKDGSAELADGEAAFKAHNLEKAAELLDESLSLSPENVDALVLMARVKLEAGEIPSAKGFIERAAARSTDTDVRFLSAQIAWYAKDSATAVRLFRELADDAKLSPAERAEAWAGVGVVEMSCENSHLSRIAFLRALRLDFKCAVARYHLGLLYRDAFNYYAAALEQFQVFARLEADATPRVQKVKLSVIPALQKQIASEAADRPGASRRDSSASAAALSRATAAERKGLNGSALKEYIAALHADPLSYPAAIGLAKCWQKTSPSTRKGGVADPLSRALENYQLACALQPSRISTYLAAGELALKIGRYAQAAEIYSRALAASPRSLDVLDGLVRALRKQGKSQVAKAYLDYRESIPPNKK